MINSLHSSAAATSSERSPLIEQLVRRADADRDGQLTTAEFSAFLEGLVQSLDRDQAAARPDAPAEPTAAAVSSPAPVDIAAALSRARAASQLRQAFDTLKGIR